MAPLTERSASVASQINPAQNEIEPPIPVGYLAGINFCGSTLLSLVLNTHPRILSVGEMGPRIDPRRERYICSCGADTRQCEFFGDVEQRMQSRGVPFDPVHMELRHRFGPNPLLHGVFSVMLPPALDRLRKTVRDRLPWVNQRLADFRQRNEAFMRAGLQSVGKDVFLDATKDAARIPFLAELHADLKVIHLVRDPRGFVYSASKRLKRSPRALARRWVQGHGETERFLRDVPTEARVRVRYEDVCADPGPQLSELTRFIGAGDFELPDDFNAYPHHLIGNNMRGSNQRRSTIRLDETWRSAVDPDVQQMVWRITGKMAQRFGYER